MTGYSAPTQDSCNEWFQTFHVSPPCSIYLRSLLHQTDFLSCSPYSVFIIKFMTRAPQKYMHVLTKCFSFPNAHALPPSCPIPFSRHAFLIIPVEVA